MRLMTSFLDPDKVIRDERELRDRGADDYDAHIAEGGWADGVADACVLDALDLHAGHTVVDVGTGTGRHLQPLLDRAARVIGLDHSEASIEIAARRVKPEDRSRVELKTADARSLPLDDATADRVVCAHVIQHVPSDEYRAQVLRELRRVLRPGGLMTITAYRWHGHVRRDKEGFWDGGLYRYAFTAREFRLALLDAGFGEVEVGGMVIMPRLAERLGSNTRVQERLVFTPLGRHLSHYVIGTGRAPAAGSC